jgi:hypothetical protein
MAGRSGLVHRGRCIVISDFVRNCSLNNFRQQTPRCRPACMPPSVAGLLLQIVGFEKRVMVFLMEDVLFITSWAIPAVLIWRYPRCRGSGLDPDRIWPLDAHPPFAAPGHLPGEGGQGRLPDGGRADEYRLVFSGSNCFYVRSLAQGPEVVPCHLTQQRHAHGLRDDDEISNRRPLARSL